MIPYSGKLSWEKTFAKMASIKISWRKLSQVNTIDWIQVVYACDVHKENFANGHISTKVFSYESFLL